MEEEKLENGRVEIINIEKHDGHAFIDILKGK